MIPDCPPTWSTLYFISSSNCSSNRRTLFFRFWMCLLRNVMEEGPPSSASTCLSRPPHLHGYTSSLALAQYEPFYRQRKLSQTLAVTQRDRWYSRHVLLAAGRRGGRVGVRVEPHAQVGAAGGRQRAGSTSQQLEESSASGLSSLPCRDATLGQVGGVVGAGGRCSVAGVDRGERLVSVQDCQQLCKHNEEREHSVTLHTDEPLTDLLRASCRQK